MLELEKICTQSRLKKDAITGKKRRKMSQPQISKEELADYLMWKNPFDYKEQSPSDRIKTLFAEMPKALYDPITSEALAKEAFYLASFEIGTSAYTPRLYTQSVRCSLEYVRHHLDCIAKGVSFNEFGEVDAEVKLDDFGDVVEETGMTREEALIKAGEMMGNGESAKLDPRIVKGISLLVKGDFDKAFNLIDAAANDHGVGSSVKRLSKSKLLYTGARARHAFLKNIHEIEGDAALQTVCRIIFSQMTGDPRFEAEYKVTTAYQLVDNCLNPSPRHAFQVRTMLLYVISKNFEPEMRVFAERLLSVLRTAHEIKDPYWGANVLSDDILSAITQMVDDLRQGRGLQAPHFKLLESITFPGSFEITAIPKSIFKMGVQNLATVPYEHSLNYSKSEPPLTVEEVADCLRLKIDVYDPSSVHKFQSQHEDCDSDGKNGDDSSEEESGEEEDDTGKGKETEDNKSKLFFWYDLQVVRDLCEKEYMRTNAYSHKGILCEHDLEEMFSDRWKLELERAKSGELLIREEEFGRLPNCSPQDASIMAAHILDHPEHWPMDARYVRAVAGLARGSVDLDRAYKTISQCYLDFTAEYGNQETETTMLSVLLYIQYVKAERERMRFFVEMVKLNDDNDKAPHEQLPFTIIEREFRSKLFRGGTSADWALYCKQVLIKCVEGGLMKSAYHVAKRLLLPIMNIQTESEWPGLKRHKQIVVALAQHLSGALNSDGDIEKITDWHKKCHRIKLTNYKTRESNSLAYELKSSSFPGERQLRAQCLKQVKRIPFDAVPDLSESTLVAVGVCRKCRIFQRFDNYKLPMCGYTTGLIISQALVPLFGIGLIPLGLLVATKPCHQNVCICPDCGAVVSQK